MTPDFPRKCLVTGLAALAFLAPLKFTEPAVLPQLAPWPGGPAAWLFQPWPIALWIALWFILALLAAVVAPRGSLRIRHAWMPAAFLSAQFVSALAHGLPESARLPLAHFAGLAAAFWLGAALLKDEDALETFGFALLAASCLVIMSGLLQVFVGAEAMRGAIEQDPRLAGMKEDLWDRLKAGRVFATFTSPNALGSFAASAFFVTAFWVSDPRPRGEERRARRWMGAAALFGLFFCVWQSRSRAALGLFVLLALATLWLWIRHRAWKIAIPAALGVAAVAGFIHEHRHDSVDSNILHGFAESAGARAAYWRAALAIGREHPVLGAGPGSFERLYEQRRPPEAGRTRLAHNDYLQMWSDSGLLGLGTFLAWLPGTLAWWMWRWRRAPREERLRPLLLWCAVAMLALHSLADYDLYMAGNSWPIFLLLGWLSQSDPRVPAAEHAVPASKSP